MKIFEECDKKSENIEENIFWTFCKNYLNEEGMNLPLMKLIIAEKETILLIKIFNQYSSYYGKVIKEYKKKYLYYVRHLYKEQNISKQLYEYNMYYWMLYTPIEIQKEIIGNKKYKKYKRTYKKYYEKNEITMNDAIDENKKKEKNNKKEFFQEMNILEYKKYGFPKKINKKLN